MGKSQPPRANRREASHPGIDALWRAAAAAGRVGGAAMSAVGRAVAAVVARMNWPLRMTALALALGAVAYGLGPLSLRVLFPLGELSGGAVGALGDEGLLAQIRWLGMGGKVAAAVLAVAAVASWLRVRVAMVAMHAAAAAFALLWLWVAALGLDVPATLHELAGDDFGEAQRNAWFLTAWLVWIPVAALWALWLLCLRYTPAWRYYLRQVADAPAEPRRAGDRVFGSLGRDRRRLGDRVFEDLRTGGRDPAFRKSTAWAVVLHLLVFVGPLVIRGCWMMSPYEIPKGSGREVVEVVQVQRVQPQEEKRFVLNLNSPIIYHIPDSKDSDVLKDVTEQTEMQYEASQLTAGEVGEGGGDTGGWPDGMEDARVRFLRLKYDGGDWDQNMGHDADYNVLLYLKKLTGFNIASDTEAVNAFQLRRFPSGKAPPFVYITGSGGIRLSSREISSLREYCLEEGGMIFADNGGGRFDGSFRGLLRRVFPGKPVVDIADDDPIYQQPFMFPNGAPPLWHHSGRRAMGVKHDGRWIVFYHQGDIGDAWRSDHSGVSKQVAMRAYKMGINVMYYAFTHYLAHHRD